MVTEMCLKSGFQWRIREHSVYIQKCFSWLKGEFSSCAVEELLLLGTNILCTRYIFRQNLNFLRIQSIYIFITDPIISVNSRINNWGPFMQFFYCVEFFFKVFWIFYRFTHFNLVSIGSERLVCFHFRFTTSMQQTKNAAMFSLWLQSNDRVWTNLQSVSISNWSKRKEQRCW